jgi:hypothetical protein
MPNRIFVNEAGFIEEVYEGDQPDDILGKALDQVAVLAKQTKSVKKPVMVMVDVTKMGKLTTASRKRTVKALKEIPFDKVAVYGYHTFTKALITLIIHAAGKDRDVKLFDTRTAAEAWLESQKR